MHRFHPPSDKVYGAGERLFACLRWIARHELPVLLSVIVLCGGGWLFVELADEVLESEMRIFDETILLALRDPADHGEPFGPAWLEEMGRDFTALGGVAVLTLITLGALTYLLLLRRVRTAVFTLVAVFGGLLISSLLKSGFDRPRPELVPHDSYVYTASFPSGHSMMAAVTYLTLAAMLCRVQPSLQLRVFLVLLAILVTLLVGISRVYLGVHWPTDVLAGWSVGAAWAALCWLVARWMQRRGAVEPASDVEPEADSQR
jgi:undecaprenyl-diphosphatase